MQVTLQKGITASLTKAAATANVALNSVYAGLAWTFAAEKFDLDLMFVGQDSAGTAVEFCFYGKKSGSGITLSEDNRTGLTAGANGQDDESKDDESLIIDLASLPANLSKGILAVSVYDNPNATNDDAFHFGAIKSVKLTIRAGKQPTDTALMTYDLAADPAYTGKKAIAIATIEKVAGEWQVNPITKPYATTKECLADFGVNV